MASHGSDQIPDASTLPTFQGWVEMLKWENFDQYRTDVDHLCRYGIDVLMGDKAVDLIVNAAPKLPNVPADADPYPDQQLLAYWNNFFATISERLWPKAFEYIQAQVPGPAEGFQAVRIRQMLQEAWIWYYTRGNERFENHLAEAQEAWRAARESKDDDGKDKGKDKDGDSAEKDGENGAGGLVEV